MAIAYAVLLFVLGHPSVDAAIVSHANASAAEVEAYRWVASCYQLLSAAVCYYGGRQWDNWARQLERASQAKSTFLATMR